MKRIFQSRRAFISLIGMTFLFIMALVNKIDTSMFIATIALGVAGANAWQNKSKSLSQESSEELAPASIPKSKK